ncbi:Hypothetical predicted protein [Olea europaea subsp. europaea]|uniref:Nose resistant-to-fluoxetine protein N-terminal domain-containing protein n=1 Tax=Olea europaea subsp. europaea TaxID=158383 RepID=A0A8S0RDL7_OLEEU|nr:Hypothetical predicted protein [Olea europaea subsp. europaea]
MKPPRWPLKFTSAISKSFLVLLLLIVSLHSISIPGHCSAAESASSPQKTQDGPPQVAEDDKQKLRTADPLTPDEQCPSEEDQQYCTSSAVASKLRRNKQNETKQRATGGDAELKLETSPAYENREEIRLTAAPPADIESDPVQSWRYKYFDEQAQGFKVRVMDESFDERLANVIHTIVSSRVVNLDFFTYNSGDPSEDAANMDSQAGPQVDDSRCGGHLSEMLQLLDEMDAKLDARRTNSSDAPLHFNERHLRVARVLDSYGRYEAGHLSGKSHSMGQFDQCISTELLFADGQAEGQLARIGAGFCWARMNLNKHLNRGLRQRAKSEFEPSESPLLLGVCLPRSCHSKTFTRNRALIQRLVDSQFRLPRSLYIDETLEVDSVFCLTQKDSAYARLSLAGRLCVAFYLLWLGLTLYATHGNHSRGESQLKGGKEATGGQNSQHGSFLSCLDLRKSWQDFVGEKYSSEAQARHETMLRNRKVELDALNPIKVLGCVFVVIGHSLVLQSAVSQDGLKASHVVETDPVVLMMVVGTVVVDTFFVITGILLGYIVMRQGNTSKAVRPEAVALKTNGVAKANHGEVSSSSSSSSSSSAQTTSTVNGDAKSKNQSTLQEFLGQWLKFTTIRHLRLVPLYFLVFWIKKSVFISYFSDRPLWDAGFNKDTNYGACRRESWFTPFSVMAAFLPLSKQCIPQAWSLATDLFFSMTIPPVLLLMPRKPKLALALGTLMIVVSNFWALHAYLSVDPHMAYELNDLRSHGFAFMFGSIHHLYTYPHFRICSILIGMMAGYYLYKFGEQNDELKEWPAWFKGWATKTSWITILLIIVGFSNAPTMRYYIAPHHQKLFTNLFTTGRIVWASCNAILFMRMVSDWRRNFLMRMFSGRFWQALVRLNLALLLIHMDVLLYFMASSTNLSYFTKQNILAGFGNAYFYSIPCAIVLHVVYENPINKLMRRYVIPKFSKSRQEP